MGKIQLKIRKALAQARSKGWSIRQIALACELDPQALQKFEADENRDLRLDTAEQVLDFFSSTITPLHVPDKPTKRFK